jgi:hypothetical protein
MTFLGEKIELSNDHTAVLKRCLQICAEKYLEDLFGRYGFRLSRVVVRMGDHNCALIMAIEIIHLPTKKALSCTEKISMIDIERSRDWNYAFGLESTTRFIPSRYIESMENISRRLRHKIEEFIKDQPMISPHSYWIDSNSTLADNFFKSNYFYSTDIYYEDNTIKAYTYKLENALNTYSNDILEDTLKRIDQNEKKNEFPYIKRLILDSKNRLSSDYFSPEFSYKYF